MVKVVQFSDGFGNFFLALISQFITTTKRYIINVTEYIFEMILIF